jgi:hypothetical protein
MLSVTSYDEETPLIVNKKQEDVAGFGGKTIGFIGGLSLLVNNITGPAMVTIPLVFQNAGWLTPTLCLLVMTILSSLASAFMCEAMACIPGNEHFQGRVEFATLVNFFFGTSGLVVSQIFINAALQCANIAAIIECSQVADTTIIAIFKKTCGLQLHPHPFAWHCVSGSSDSDSPFPDGEYYLFTIGFLVMMVLVIPMGMLNLDDNIIVQILADVFLVVVTIDFIVAFIMNGLDVSRVPVIGPNQTIVLGQIMANYGFVTTIPSWCSEKKRDVSVDKSVWSATLIATTTFFLLGYLGALAFHFPANGDILSVINNSKESNAFDRVLVYLFPLMVLATTIPVFSIIVRYNLLQNKVFPKGISNFVAVVLPWLVVIPFLTGDGLNNILNWGTLVFSSVANFIIPFVVYLRAAKFRDRASTILSDKQHIILKELGLRDNKMLVNSDRDFAGQKPYQALPPRLAEYSREVALGSALVLGALVVMGIVLNIIQVA